MSKEDFQNLDEHNIDDYTKIDRQDQVTEAEKTLDAEAQANESILKEEAIVSPTRMMINNFLSNKLGLVGLIGFIAVFLIVFIGSALIPYDPYYSQPVLKNLAPGAGYMAYPNELEAEGIKDIQVGTTFAAGISNEGNIYTWGHEIAGNAELPAELENYQGTYEHLLVGDKHILAATSNGEFIGWGQNNFGQADFPKNLESLVKNEGIKKLGGNDLYSVLLTEKGKIRVWGATLPTRLNLIDPRLDGQVEDFVTSTTNILLLLKDGSLTVIGQRGTEIDTELPEELTDGSINIEQIGRMRYSGIAIDDKGEIYTWGARSDGMTPVPEMEGKIVKIKSGREHIAVLTDTGKVYSWGKDNYGSTKAPEADGYSDLYVGYFNNYAIKEDGKADTWGLDGFRLGSDEQGRDMFTRIVHGGRMSLLVAFVSVVIQVVIGTIVGIVSGFYGGWIDNLLMRFGEIVSSFPFYPLIITLSAILPVDVSQNQRLMMIMVILGMLNWPALARLIRGEILSEREKDYITAAKALGQTEVKTMVTHMLPNIISLIIVRATIGYAVNLLVEAALSFVGFGVRPPFPSWGNILTDSNNVTALENYWWRWIPTGLAVFTAALTVNLMGDALNQAVDPRSQER